MELPSLSNMLLMQGIGYLLMMVFMLKAQKSMHMQCSLPFLGTNSIGDYIAHDWAKSDLWTTIHRFVSLLLLVIFVQVGIVCDLVLVWLGLAV